MSIRHAGWLAGCVLVATVAACRQAPPDPSPAPAAGAPMAAPASAAGRADGTATDPGPDASLASPANDTARGFELPGRFAARPRIDALRQWYGATNAVEGEVPGAEGETWQGVILFPDDPRRRAYVYTDEGRASSVRVFDTPSDWRLDNGITIGTPLARVLELNGRPVRFYGLDWDYGGNVADWNGGTLAPDPAADVDRSLRLGRRDGADTAKVPVGDGEFSSADPRYPGIGRNLVVVEIGIGIADTVQTGDESP